MIDYHMHTDHSGDGVTPLEAVVEGAISKGCREIALTSHYDAQYPLWPLENYEPDLARYHADLLEAKARYRGRIVLKTGVELGLQADAPLVAQKTAAALGDLPFDFFIGSLHCLQPQPVADESDYWQGYDQQRFCERVASQLVRIIAQYDCFDVLGHLTYFSRYCPLEQKRSLYAHAPEHWDEVFRALIQKGKGLEVNTSSYGTLGFFLPDIDFFTRYRALGGEIVTMGSDAHVPERIAQHFGEAKQMLRTAGFRYQTTFEGHVPSFAAL